MTKYGGLKYSGKTSCIRQNVEVLQYNNRKFVSKTFQKRYILTNEDI